MRSLTRRLRFALVCFSAIAVGCTWVPLTADGEQVQLATPKFVAGCQQVGKTRAKTKPTVLGVARGAATIRQELSALARNDAAELGGTTISPLGEVEAGQQTFGIYICQGGQGGAER